MADDCNQNVTKNVPRLMTDKWVAHLITRKEILGESSCQGEIKMTFKSFKGYCTTYMMLSCSVSSKSLSDSKYCHSDSQITF